ncbi:MAG: rod shape-determining protein MreD [Ardenticatenaceae bacterium]
MSPWMFLLVLAALLQSTFLSEITWFGVHPNLMLTLVVSWTLLRGGREGLSWGFLGGLILDLLSILPFGTFTIALLVTALFTSLSEITYFKPTRALQAGMMLLVSPLFHLTAMATMQTLGWQVGWARSLSLLPSAAMVDALLILLLFPFIRRLTHLAGNRAIDWR